MSGQWRDLADWRGPTRNTGGRMVEHRGLVVHIAEGYYEGTISWQLNPRSEVSSHFVISRGGVIAQLVDVERVAWTQRSGNGHWWSAEFEGFTMGHDRHMPGWERLTGDQIEAAAKLLARMHRDYGVPLQLATEADGRGLGHHSMGGPSWGHQACPGGPIIRQKPTIVHRARVLAGVEAPTDPVDRPDPHNWTGEVMEQLPTLRRGSKGTPVKRLQALLNVAGQKLTEDGDFGPATDRAVRAEQSQARIKVDGIAGQQTWPVLLGVTK